MQKLQVLLKKYILKLRKWETWIVFKVKSVVPIPYLSEYLTFYHERQWNDVENKYIDIPDIVINKIELVS